MSADGQGLGMSELTAGRFNEFFTALWERTAFSWQRELAKRVIANAEKPWPDAIALPTASGKTACIDIGVYALAVQAQHIDTGKQLTAARRIFFVVDRRIIVDEAYARARNIAAKLRDVKNGILKEVADLLRMVSRGEEGGADDEDPLAVFELRGGMYRSEAWARSPLQPTVVTSTVDQLGSRLLFRAYGRGPGMWPVYAGLAANDSLILLDEAHCSQPFLQTLQAVSRYRTWAETPLPTRFYPVVMSATPPSGLEDVFRDNSDEARNLDYPLGQRQLASKPTALRVIEKAKGKNAFSELAKALVREAESIVQHGPKAVVIFVNRVATAREAYKLLADKHSSRAVLLTGRMRPIDRDDTILERLKPLASNQSVERKLEEPLFVVATQTLEVGADLDFDGLVTECASLDALRQRFGRLNRMGRRINARAAVLIRVDQADSSEDDPVYGAALAKTWQWLQKQRAENGEVDFGVSALAARLPANDDLAALNAPSLNALVMLPAHIDCWAQTSPAPEPTPDIGPFLRGPERENADVQVCWRADIYLESENSTVASLDVLAVCPPAATECLPVPINVFRSWMAAEKVEDDTADVEGFADDNGAQKKNHEARCIVRWRGRQEAEATDDPDSIRPGDVLVIPAKAEGWEHLGDLPHALDMDPTLDWGDRAHRQTRAKALLRLHPAVIEQWPECAAKAHLLELAKEAHMRYEEDPDTLVDELQDALMSLGKDEGAPDWLGEIALTLTKDKRLDRGIRPHPFGGLIIQGTRRLPAVSEDTDRFSDEDDVAASGTVRVPLFQHLPGVAAHAKRFASGCGLPQALIQAVEQAGLLHDLGKADLRFQALLHNGSPWTGDVLLAKSNDMPQGRSAYKQACKAAGYPEGGRHELLSVRLVESTSGLLPDDDTLSDLVLHLVASHHGYCRPFAPVVFDEKPIEVNLEFNGHRLVHSSVTEMERLDSGVTDRFWHLIRRYGWWGIAWLEAILRLADHRRSEAEIALAEEADE
jgi:CRISPR-associated endonuclease/helicase Cas3